ncbi:hypothetical protein HELRODRAFT_87686 [Helobdella robusta]|uniref:Protein kinase domain-containing protein n=1 Tax=Helobdella robusta TaxID=6412 RepID=T1G6U2_HELRO|nr:hypothetical protein HELRODRAFT_87686 [Helobdella robusta]ESN94036.1 hypothetical protein HELRODRAFT_87686 [Helobdella robusta]
MLHLSSCSPCTEVYEPTGEILGTGSFGSVQTYRSIKDHKEFAVKIVEKKSSKTRKKVLKEIELFHHCRGHPNILQMIEYFEEADVFYLVFEKMEGGTLLSTIGKRGHLTEQEASLVIRDVANAISHLHKKGIAHRDLKPENILCALPNQLTPVKLCDFDLGNDIHINSKRTSPITTPVLQSPVGSVEFMAPEVVDVWQDVANSYNKRCDLWSLGIILYILLCGYVPFYANCGDSCGWENGGACTACQDILFDNIQLGIYDFPEKEWSSISMSAKDLISHLLVRNPAERYSTEEVLQHPWITTDGEELPLATPDVLKKTNSVRELQVFTENANAANRKIQQELSRSVSKSSGLTLLTHPACRKSGRLEDDERRRSLSSLHNFDLDDDSDIDCGLVMSSPPRNAITIPPRNNTFQGITRSGKNRSRYGNHEGGYGDGLQIESFSDSGKDYLPLMNFYY